MKKIILILMSFVMLMSFAGCFATGNTEDSEADKITGDASTENAEDKIAAVALADAKVGDIIEFGNYIQSDEEAAEKEKVRWIVLAKENDRVLVISQKALDCQPYNTENKEVTWETCTLRTWLNDTFIKAAFSKEEQSVILETQVAAEDNTEWATEAGNDTNDKVFLLSISEIDKYFTSDIAKTCAPTKYAVKNGAWKISKGYSLWWLRNPGKSQSYTAYVYSYGVETAEFVGGSGRNVADKRCAVRPAMWIEMK